MVDKIRDCQALVVDNNPVIVKLVSSILKGQGYVVHIAVDGLEAIGLVDKFRPNIIFTDLIMPGIDGIKLCHIIRNTPEYKDIFIVILSAVAAENNIDLVEIGADLCIAKGTSVNIRRHVLAALDCMNAENRELSRDVKGGKLIYPRDVVRELLLNKRYYDVVFTQMLEGYLELNEQGRILRVNPACCRIFQMDEVEMLTSHFQELLPEKNAEALSQWMENIFVQEVSVPLIFDHDNPIILRNQYVTFNFVPVKDDNRFTVIVICQDVTSSKEMERKRKQLEHTAGQMHTLEALTGMAGGLAHDFNNLLTVIKGNVEIAQRVSNEDKVISLLSETEQALILATDLVRQLSQLSDNYNPERTVVCVDGMLTDILEQELAGTKVTLDFTSDGGKYYSNLNIDLIVKGLRNIILNAVEAMDGAGKLQVRLSAVNSRDDADWLEQLKEGVRYVHITLEDTGSGVSAKVIDKVFTPYFSSKQRGSSKGMGLGLTIAHSAIIKHDGLIRLGPLSRSDGCLVSIYLPVTSAP